MYQLEWLAVTWSKSEHLSLFSVKRWGCHLGQGPVGVLTGVWVCVCVGEFLIQLLDGGFNIQALVVQTLDSAIHQTNHYPVDCIIDFCNTYPLDSDLSGG